MTIPTLIHADYEALTADGTVCTGEGYLFGILIETDRANDPTFSVYDNTAGSGNKLFGEQEIDASMKGFNGFFPQSPIHFSNGMYLDKDATTATYTFYYRLKKDVVDGAIL